MSLVSISAINSGSCDAHNDAAKASAKMPVILVSLLLHILCSIKTD